MEILGAVWGMTFGAQDSATNYATGGTLVVVLGLVLTFAGKQLLDSRRDNEKEDELLEAAQSTLVKPLTDENVRLREVLGRREVEVDALRGSIAKRYQVQSRLERLLRQNNVDIPPEVYL